MNLEVVQIHLFDLPRSRITRLHLSTSGAPICPTCKKQMQPDYDQLKGL